MACWHVAVAEYTRGNLARFFAASTTTIEAIKREPKRETNGAIAAPTPTDHRTSYPGSSTYKNIIAAAIPIFLPARSAKPHDNRPNETKKEYSLKSSIASSPSLLHARRFEAPSAHPRDPGSDGFLGWAAKREEGLVAAHPQRRKSSLLSTLVGVRQQDVV